MQPLFAYWHLSCKFEVSNTISMKKLLVLTCMCAVLSYAGAQTGHEGHNHDVKTDSLPKADDQLKLKEASYNFGLIPQGKPVYYNFEIVNTGTQPLKLDNVQASCGCTTPEWSHEVIAPGGTSVIKVGYNAAGEGAFEKFITISYNGAQTKQLKITGNVWKAPDGSAPVNTSVQFLKKQTL
jgi:hypothetical protein